MLKFFKKNKWLTVKELIVVLAITGAMAVAWVYLLYQHLNEQQIRDVYDEFTNKVLLQNMK